MCDEAKRHLVAADQLASEWGLSPRMFQRLAQRGEIPVYRIGRLLRFDPGEVREALREGATTSRTGAKDGKP